MSSLRLHVDESYEAPARNPDVLPFPGGVVGRIGPWRPKNAWPETGSVARAEDALARVTRDVERLGALMGMRQDPDRPRAA